MLNAQEPEFVAMHAARLSLKVCMHLWRRAVMCEVWLCSALGARKRECHKTVAQ